MLRKITIPKEGISFVLLSNEDNQLISKCDRVYFCRGTSIVDVIFKDEYSHGLFQKIMYNNISCREKCPKCIQLYDISLKILHRQFHNPCFHSSHPHSHDRK